MNDSIPLHPTKCLDPRLGLCQRCGKENGEIVLVGNGKIYRCRGCQAANLAYRRPDKCGSCGESEERYGEGFTVEPVPDGRHLPGSTCDACVKELEEHRAVVAAGGVYFKCVDCGTQGVVKAEAPFAGMVRKHAGIQPPDPVGAEFSKADCPKCGPNPVAG